MKRWLVGVVGLGSAVALAAGVSMAVEPQPPITEQPVDWTVQFGTAGNDTTDGYGTIVATAPNGEVYTTFGSNGTFDGLPASQNYDAYVARYDRSGRRKWLRQLASDQYDLPQAIAVAPNGDKIGRAHV